MLMTSGRRRALLVEDEFLSAILLQEMLDELGYDVVGPARTLNEALDMAKGGDFDVGILDVHLGSATSFPVAEVLRQRDIPFVFATASGFDGSDKAYMNHTVLPKPFQIHDLQRAFDLIQFTQFRERRGADLEEEWQPLDDGKAV